MSGSRRDPSEVVEVGRPTSIDAVFSVASRGDVESPFSGRRAAFFHVELVEVDADGREEPFAELVVGDVLTLRAGRAVVSFVVRRAVFRLVSARPPLVPLEKGPPEAAAFLARARGRGTVAYREHAVRANDRVRLRAVVERTEVPPQAGRQPEGPIKADLHRSEGTDLPFLVRADLAPVVVDEVPA